MFLSGITNPKRQLSHNHHQTRLGALPYPHLFCIWDQARVGGNFDFLETLFLWSPLCRLFLERRLSQFKVGCHHQSTTFTIRAVWCGVVQWRWRGAGTVRRRRTHSHPACPFDADDFFDQRMLISLVFELLFFILQFKTVNHNVFTNLTDLCSCCQKQTVNPTSY